jgi:hypothetical protein
MDVTDEQLLREAQAMALYIRFADRRITELEAENAALRAAAIPEAEPPPPEPQGADQHTP